MKKVIFSLFGDPSNESKVFHYFYWATVIFWALFIVVSFIEIFNTGKWAELIGVLIFAILAALLFRVLLSIISKLKRNAS
ncbi:hypothetical protein [Thalassobacillus hwangdonensis]|uniref:Uncharacterized protein n=1 Tax=Thalassobacillus hwangdonensis TaxID=546108 RepID=A0ABW3L6F3_9BACI